MPGVVWLLAASAVPWTARKHTPSCATIATASGNLTVLAQWLFPKFGTDFFIVSAQIFFVNSTPPLRSNLAPPGRFVPLRYYDSHSPQNFQVPRRKLLHSS